MAASQPMTRRINERRLYVFLAILTPIIILIGFGRTYYLKPLFHAPNIPNRLVHLHGLIMTSWVVLFVTQVGLIAARRVKTHQRLGIIGSGLALLVFVVGIVTALDAVNRGASPGPPPLQFLIISLGDMVIFGILVGSALYFRRRPDVHKRLMLLAAVNLMGPAIGRIQLDFIQNGGPLAFFGITDIILLAFVVFDTIKHRRLHPVFLWGTIALIVAQPLRLFLAGTGLWMSIATFLVKLVK